MTSDLGHDVSADWLEVCRAEDVPMSDMRPYVVGDRKVVVYHVGDRYFASDDRCTHQAVCLSDGTLDGEVIECPFHGGAFDVVSGEVRARPPRKPLQTHDVRVEGGSVFLRLKGE